MGKLTKYGITVEYEGAYPTGATRTVTVTSISVNSATAASHFAGGSSRKLVLTIGGTTIASQTVPSGSSTEAVRSYVENFQNVVRQKMSNGSAKKSWTRTHSAQTSSAVLSVWGASDTNSISIAARTSYAVSFNANGGSGAPGSQTKWYGESLTLPSSKPTRANHVFKCWNTAAGGGGTSYNPGASYTANAAATLYAQWHAPYTVSYNANGGSGAPGSQTKVYNSTLQLSTVEPTRTNHRFLGWATSASGTVAYSPGASYTANAAATLYAVWQKVYESPGLTIDRSYRCDASGNAADEGVYAAVALSWSTYDANALQSLSVTVNGVTANRADMDLDTAADGRSGTALAVIAANLELNSSYAVTATITDAGCQASGVSGSSPTSSRGDSISQAYFTITFRPGGHGCGIGAPASEEGYLRIAHHIRQLDSRGNTVMHMTQDGNLSVSGTVSQGSDRRLKKPVSALGADACEFVRSLVPVLYEKRGELEVGFYAQDVAAAEPWGTAMVRKGDDGFLELCYTQIIAPLVAYCQQLEKRIDALGG